MEGSYISLPDLKPNQSRQNSDDTVPLNDSNTAAINKPGFFEFNLVRFCKTFVRWLVTSIFIAFVFATLKVYQNKGNFSARQKTNFNVIITAESLCLGLNFFVSHKVHAPGWHMETLN